VEFSQFHRGARLCFSLFAHLRDGRAHIAPHSRRDGSLARLIACRLHLFFGSGERQVPSMPGFLGGAA
jgi:hypothetical protein